MIRRRLFTIASIASALLCIGTVALWVRSYWVDYSAGYARNDLQRLRRLGFSVEASGGQVEFGQFVADYTATPRAQNVARRHMPAGRFFHAAEDRSRFTALGGWGLHGYFREKWNAVDTVSTLIVPLWLPVLFFGLPPALWWKLRDHPTVCPTCGYNLTGNTSGTCPECGTPIPSKPEVIA